MSTRSGPAVGPTASNEPLTQRWSALLEVVEEKMPRFLLRRRWYPAKDLTAVPQVTATGLIPFPAPGSNAAIATWEVKSNLRETIRMFVPLALIAAAEADPSHLIATVAHKPGGQEDTAVIDAFSRDAFVRAWVNLHLGRSGSVPPELLKVGRTEHLTTEVLSPSGHWEIKQGTAEQSNTSIRVGERAILKVFRKLEAGIHPELEVGRYLTQVGFKATPAVLGWVEIKDGGDLTSCTASILQTFVPNEGDGWSWTLKRLTHTLMSNEESPWSETVRWLRRLAQRTAEMHRAFAADSPAVSFQPERVAAADLSAWAESASAMGARALGEIEGRSGEAGSQVLRLTCELRSRRSALEHIIRNLAAMPASFSKTRHHGDFHLGQTLVVENDAFIIDFEGEPLRPIAERRAKHCVLRDVAGILRSFSYATATVERALAQNSTPQQREGARARLNAWRTRASSAFVETYFAAAQGIPSLPVEKGQAERLLHFFLLEKALYEITYEMANRPDWVEIPLRGVLDILDLAAEDA